MPPAALLTQTLATFLNIYIMLLVVRCLLTWFRNVSALDRLASLLSPITDPYLDLFRGLIPPLGGTMDISPVVAILVLQLVAGLFSGVQTGSAF